MKKEINPLASMFEEQASEDSDEESNDDEDISALERNQAKGKDNISVFIIILISFGK